MTGPKDARCTSPSLLLPDSLCRPLSRRQIVSQLGVASLATLALSEAAILGRAALAREIVDPLAPVRNQHWQTFLAFVETQLDALGGGLVIDDAFGVAEAALRYAEFLAPRNQRQIASSLLQLSLYSVMTSGKQLYELSIARRKLLLNQGEYHDGRSSAFPLIIWQQKWRVHAAVSGLTQLSRLVICSRPGARQYIGMSWSEACAQPRFFTDQSPPAYPDLDESYDLCIVGSGAGGAVVAARAAAAGLRVVVVEEGAWVAPAELVQRSGAGGSLLAPQDTQALMSLYKGAGVQWMSDYDPLAQDALDETPPPQLINCIQARVVGGGPYVNNAIHLEIDEPIWKAWQNAAGITRPYADLKEKMQTVAQLLGVNTQAIAVKAGAAGRAFAAKAARAGVPVLPLPVAIRPEGAACGSDNTADPFDGHVGGLHSFRPSGPNSFLMQALHARWPAQIAYEQRAMRFVMKPMAANRPPQIEHLLVEDRRGLAPDAFGVLRKIKARRFVLAAGVGGSTEILARTLSAARLSNAHLGKGLTANVVAPVYAVFDRPLHGVDSDVPNPGLAMCFYVKEVLAQGAAPGGDVKEPLLESWFQYPGTLTVSLAGWFSEWVKVMKCYNNLSICGALVATSAKPQCYIDAEGQLNLSLDDKEFAQALRGIRKIGSIYLTGTRGTNDRDGVSLYLPTKAVLLDNEKRPLQIRSMAQLDRAIEIIRRLGPEFLQLTTFHPQGGNALGSVVDPNTFRVMVDGGQQLDNLYLTDASIFPDACRTNPQLTLKALALAAADQIVTDSLA